MGYTHYYELKKEISQKKWDAFVKDVKTLRKHLPKHSHSSGGYFSDEPLFLNGCIQHKRAVFDDEKILFNGGDFSASKRKKINGNGYYETEGLSHETFYLSRKGGQEFCKTARKPYDLMVQSVILLAKHHFKDDFSFSSDGELEDWQVAFRFVTKCFPHIKNIPNNL